MIRTLLSRALPGLVAAAALLGAGAAQAALVQVATAGDTVVFYYDPTLWNGATPTVSGDTISFASTGALAHAGAGGNGGYDSITLNAGIALAVAPKAGYSFAQQAFNFAANFTGQFVASDGSFVGATTYGSVAYGTLAGTTPNITFTQDSLAPVGSPFTDTATDVVTGPTPVDLVGNPSAYSGTAPFGSALGLFDVTYYAFADGASSDFARIDSLLYSVSAARIVNDIPEPGTLALLAIALGAATVVQRRRQRG